MTLGSASLTTGGDNTSPVAAYAGVISGTGNLTKIGTGNQTLSGLNTYSGVTTINAGTLSVSYFNAGGVAGPLGMAPNVAANLIINGGTLQYSSTYDSTSDREFTIGTLGGGLASSGTGAVTLTASPTMAGTDTARTLTLKGASTALNALTGVIGDNGTGATAVTKTEAGAWQLAGSASNTYTGVTTVSQGTLNLGKTGGAKAIIGALLMNGPDGTYLRTQQADQFGPGVVANMPSAGGAWNRFEFFGKDQTLAGINTGNSTTQGGGIFQNSEANGAAGAPATLTLNGSGTYLFNGHIRDYGGNAVGTYPLSLIKSGTGTQSLYGSVIVFSGNITINGGTLNGNRFGINSNSRTITVNNTGTFELLAGNVFGGHNATTAPTLVINSGGIVTNASPATNNGLNNVTLNGGTLTSTIGSTSVIGGTRPTDTYGAWNINGKVTSTGSSLITTTAPINGHVWLGSAGLNTIFEVVSDTLTVATPLMSGENATLNGVTKTGAGTLLLSAANVYTGNTNVNAGTLALADNAQLKFVLGATSGVSNKITGTGTVNLDGDFVITTTAADALPIGSSWTLVDNTTLTETYTSNFSVAGFIDAGGNTWTKQNRAHQDVRLRRSHRGAHA